MYKQHMENLMATKENPRDERIPVLLTKAEREMLQAAADKVGLGLSTFIRVKALEAVNVAP